MRLTVKRKTLYPTGPNGERLPAIDVAAGCEIAGSIGQAPAVARMVIDSMTPASQSEIERWLAELSVLVIRGKSDEFSDELRIEAYAGRLQQFPADVVHHVLLKQSWKFWPSWQEIETACEALTSPRQHMLAALENPRAETPPEPRERVSGDRAKEILSEIGFTPKRMAQVQRRPMARTDEELAAPDAEPAKWTCETDPERLRAARLKTQIGKEALAHADSNPSPAKQDLQSGAEGND